MPLRESDLLPQKRISKSAHKSSVPDLLFQISAARLPQPMTEYSFSRSRKWRFDLAWMLQRDYGLRCIAVEIEGGAFLPQGSRHTRGAGFRKDCEKYMEAAILGWTVVRIMPEHVKSGQALNWLERLLA